jgi:hypothetical protein
LRNSGDHPVRPELLEAVGHGTQNHLGMPMVTVANLCDGPRSLRHRTQWRSNTRFVATAVDRFAADAALQPPHVGANARLQFPPSCHGHVSPKLRVSASIRAGVRRGGERRWV